MKPEHTKPFSLIDAKAGAPYAQRRGHAARIGIWDANHKGYPLMGVQTSGDGTEVLSSWSLEGKFRNSELAHETDLVMLPLGYCEDKPVFVGDVLKHFNGAVISAHSMTRKFNDLHWPRTSPVMPKAKGFHECAGGDVDLICAIFIATQREEIEAYWKALDEYEGAGK